MVTTALGLQFWNQDPFPPLPFSCRFKKITCAVLWTSWRKPPEKWRGCPRPQKMCLPWVQGLLQLLSSPKLLPCCVRNVPPKQKACLLLPADFYIEMEITYWRSGSQGGGFLWGRPGWGGVASLCGSGLGFAAPGHREFCSFYPTNPHNRHTSAP